MNFNFMDYVGSRTFILTGINWFLCMGVIWTCLCRLRLTTTDTLISARSVFVFILVVSFTSAFRGPLLGDQVTSWWSIMLTVCILALMFINMGAWKKRPPMNMQKPTAPAPLDGEEE